MSRIQNVSKILLNHKYKRAIKTLYKASDASKRAVVEAVQDLAREEMKAFTKKGDSFLCQAPCADSFYRFSWEDLLENIGENMPILLAVTKGTITSKRNEISLTRYYTKSNLMNNTKSINKYIALFIFIFIKVIVFNISKNL